MSEPWDIPPFPKRGDGSDRTTYAAVGQALSQWESMEVEFAHLYSVLTAFSRFNPTANKEYGEDPNFKDRLAKLERAGEKYFVAHCSQADESDFCGLVLRARRFSLRRNDIAHSIVRPIHWIKEPGASLLSGPAKYRWCLVPPHFKASKFTKNRMPLYVYTSKEIAALTGYFRGLTMDINRFTFRLDSRHAPSRRIFPLPETVLSKALAERNPQADEHPPQSSEG